MRLLLVLLPLLVVVHVVESSEIRHCSAASIAPSSAEVSMGTTLVALVYKHGIVVGADTRTSVSGYVSNRYAHKWTPITSHVLVGRSGSAADTQRLCEETKWELESLRYQHGRRLFSTSQVANLLRSRLRKEDLSASLLCVGVDGCDTENGETEHPGEIYSLSATGALLKEDGFAVSGSGSTYILGHMDSLLATKSPGEMEEDEAIRCVETAIQLAMDRDGSSGGMARIHVLNRDGRRSVNIYPTGSNNGLNNSRQPSTTDNTGNDLPGFASASREYH